MQRLLCDDLERLADHLPGLPTLPELRRISDRILRITSSHFARAEQVLRTMLPEQRPTPEMLDALHRMHVLDELHGQDLVMTLWQHVGIVGHADVGQLSYMLRCFFDYSHYVGDVFGAPLAIEGLMAFFLEATFVGVMFFGWDRLSKRGHLLTTIMVALGSNLSAVWILVANGWMQHPVGCGHSIPRRCGWKSPIS